MSHFLIRRALALLLTLLAASAVIFMVLEVLPGNVAQVMMGPDADPEAVRTLASQLGLDRPAWQRYVEWLLGLMRGELGDSQVYGSPVLDLLQERMALTVPLALLAMVVTIVLALGVGVYAALHHRRWADTALMALAQIAVAMPSFWLAMLLILVFSVWLNWVPAGGFDGWQPDLDGSWWQGMLNGLRALLLPALALAGVQTAILARFVRSSMLEVQGEAFVRTARAKGLSSRQILWRHVFRNALIPVMTVAGMQFAELMAGAVVIENVFSLPGLGRLLFQSIANRDLIVVRNCVLLLVAMVVVLNFIVDVFYALIDPRLRARAL
ncbi:MAG: ABC transporter permease [Lautropia sp.]|nr:ABC transporter permease [Lautropia sp.]